MFGQEHRPLVVGMNVGPARVYRMTPSRLHHWETKGQTDCSVCSTHLEVGDWVLAKSGRGHDKVRHLTCAVRLRICDLSELPEEARSSLEATIEM